MNYYEEPGNTAARGCSGSERSKWRDAGVDPDLVDRPDYRSSVARDIGPAATQEAIDFQLPVGDVQPDESTSYTDEAR